MLHPALRAPEAVYAARAEEWKLHLGQSKSKAKQRPMWGGGSDGVGVKRIHDDGDEKDDDDDDEEADDNNVMSKCESTAESWFLEPSRKIKLVHEIGVKLQC